MAAANVLADMLVRLGVDSTDLKKGLEEMGVEFRKIPKAVNEAMKPAEKSFASLGEAAARYARDQRAEAKTAGFFVNQIAEVVPISKEAKGAITELGGALVGGGALGLGLAVATISVGALAKAMYDQSAAAEEALKATKEWGATLSQDLDKNLAAAKLLNAELREGALGRAQAQADLERTSASKTMIEATQRRVAAEKEFNRLFTSGWRGISGNPIGFDAARENLFQAHQNEENALENLRAVTQRTEGEITKVRKANADAQTRTVEEAVDKRTAAEKREYEERLKLAQAAAKFGEPYAAGADDNMLGGITPKKLDESRPDMSRFNDLVAEQGRVWEETRTPAEKYAEELERLRVLYDETAIDADTYNRAVAKATEAYQASNQVAAAMFSSLGQGFRQVITGAQSLEAAAEGVWSRMLDTFIAMVEQMVTKWIVAQATMAAVSVATGGIGAGGEANLGAVYGIGGGLGAEFFAEGGDIRAGQLAVVGERGPELFVPGASGKIIPNDQLAGGGRTLVIAPRLVDGHGFGEWWERNQELIVRKLDRLSYLGRTGG